MKNLSVVIISSPVAKPFKGKQIVFNGRHIMYIREVIPGAGCKIGYSKEYDKASHIVEDSVFNKASSKEGMLVHFKHLTELTCEHTTKHGTKYWMPLDDNQWSIAIESGFVDTKQELPIVGKFINEEESIKVKFK